MVLTTRKIKINYFSGTLVVLDYGGRDEKMSEVLLSNLDFISPNEVSDYIEMIIFYLIKDRAFKTSRFG